MRLFIRNDGTVRGVYRDRLKPLLRALAPGDASLGLRRASHVTPDDEGNFLADLSPVGGPCLGPFPTYAEAVEAEVAWIEDRLRRGETLR